MVENLLIRLKNFHYIPYDITHQREFCGTFVHTTKSTGNLSVISAKYHSIPTQDLMAFLWCFLKKSHVIFLIILWYKGTFVRMFFVVFLIRYDLLYCIKKVPRSLYITSTIL